MKSYKYDVVIPTYRSGEVIASLLSSLAIQTHKPSQVIIVLDQEVNQAQYDEYCDYLKHFVGGLSFLVVSHVSHDFVASQGVSYVRNRGLEYAKSDYVLFVDDDNCLPRDCMQALSKEYRYLSQYHKELVVMPSEYYRDTQIVRSQGYRDCSFWLGWLRADKVVAGDQHKKIRFASSNCLFGPTSLMREYQFNESMGFVYEDIESTGRMTKSGVSLYALTNVFVSHMMRTKTSLQESYLHTNKLAYQKGKNRIMRVKNTANFVQKCEYFVCGLHLHTVSLMYKVVRYVPFRQIPSRLRSLLKGTLVGLFS